MSSRFQSRLFVETHSTEKLLPPRKSTTELLEDDDYNALPEPLKNAYSRDEFLWLSDKEKATLVQRECEPDWTE